MHARLTAGFQESYPYAGIMIGRTNALLVEVQPCSDPLVGHSEKSFGLAFRKVCQGPEGQRHYDLISASILREACALVCRQVRYGQPSDLGDHAAKLHTTRLRGPRHEQDAAGETNSAGPLAAAKVPPASVLTVLFRV